LEIFRFLGVVCGDALGKNEFVFVERTKKIPAIKPINKTKRPKIVGMFFFDKEPRPAAICI
jgi:hypothetical protein